MEDFSRVGLYRWTLNLLTETESGRKEYGVLMSLFPEKDGMDEIMRILSYNIDILAGIETLFADKTKRDAYANNENSERIINLFSERYRYSVIREYFGEEAAKSFTSEIENTKKGKNVFNKILSGLNSKNDSRLKNIKLLDRKSVGTPRKKQVFLSYAFTDRLYTLCLFLYMYSQGVRMYVDWLFTPEKESGKEIKATLTKELKRSFQLLFIRSPQSELEIQGKPTIRGWCSWELGSFYQLSNSQSSEKYCIELYGPIDVKADNMQLDGIKPLTGVANGKLY